MTGERAIDWIAHILFKFAGISQDLTGILYNEYHFHCEIEGNVI